MKKLISLVLAAACVLSLAACGSSSSTATTAAPATTAAAPAASEAAPAAENFVFKHGFDLDYPPYSHIDSNGQISGFDVELAQAVCEYYGWGYEAVPFNWDAKDAELNAGSCDCIWSGFTLEGREDDYTWSIPYSNNTQMIMVPKDSDIKTLADLAGKIVGVQTSTSAYDMLEDDERQGALAKTFESLSVYETYTIAFNDLKAGAIDAIAIDVTAGNHLMGDSGDYVYLDETLGTESYAIGFRKGDTELRDKINAALEELAKNGKYDEIGKKYPEIYDYLCLNK